MNISEIIKKDDVLLSVEASCTKQAFCDLSEHICEKHGLPQRAMFDALIMREKLGSTCVGEGVSIPHARVKNIPQMIGVFARLNQPINMDALDERPIDLMLMLIAPEDDQSEHMKALARISRILRDEGNRRVLREAESRDEMYSVLISHDN